MLRTLVEDYFANGGMEAQFNVVSRETLLAAKQDPQKYRNLVVRVSGFSAYFVTLDPVLQDEIINRTENQGI
jgi:formate C-acetyltransferase